MKHFNIKRLSVFLAVTISVILPGCSKPSLAGDSNGEQGNSVSIAGTSWGRVYSGTQLSCKLYFSESSCTVTYYSDEGFHNQQSSASASYTINGDKIQFGSNFVVSVVPPKNGQQQYRRFNYARLKSKSSLQVSLDTKVGNGSWSGGDLVTFTKK